MGYDFINHRDEELPSPSDFSEEMREQAYEEWASYRFLDPDEQETARMYEEWFTDEYQDEDWYRSV